MPQPPPSLAADALASTLAGQGHVLLRREAMLVQLAPHGNLDDWSAFAASWHDMPLDAYMADGGRYRRRRYGVYTARRGGSLIREPHQPHWQSVRYNQLNGGVARWFEPIPTTLDHGDCLPTILRCACATFAALAPEVAQWHVEVHQFRIEAAIGQDGQPTPEGVHRDGVDYVLVLLVRRENIASGTTTIHAPDRTLLGSFTLTRPCDATLLDDHRVFHGVTPVVPVDARAPAWRDVLVVTLRREPPTDHLP